MIPRKYIKYYIYLCLYDKPCENKVLDKKTKLPICKKAGVESEPKIQCNQQYITSQAFISKTKMTIDDFRRIKFQGIQVE